MQKLVLLCLLAGTVLADPSVSQGNKIKLLELQKLHFETSLKHLLASFTLSSPGFERPGLAKVTREQSDKHWESGMSAIKKYFQRGEKHNDDDFNAKFTLEKIANPLAEKASLRQTFATFYVAQLKKLITSSTGAALKLDEFPMRAHHHSTTGPKHDHDMALFVQERAKEERETLRDLIVLQKTLGKIFTKGVALDIFDRTLL